MSGIAGALINTAGNLIGAGVNYGLGQLSAKQQQKYTQDNMALAQKYALESAEKQQQYNKEMAKYNDELNRQLAIDNKSLQRQSYETAGYNPLLANDGTTTAPYQGGNVQVGSAGAQAGAKPDYSGTGQLLANTSQAYNQFLQSEMMERNIEGKDIENEGNKLSNNLKQEGIKLTKAQTDQIVENTKKIEFEKQNIQAQIKNLDAKTREIMTDTFLKKGGKLAQDIGYDTYIAIKKTYPNDINMQYAALVNAGLQGVGFDYFKKTEKEISDSMKKLKNNSKNKGEKSNKNIQDDKDNITGTLMMFM